MIGLKFRKETYNQLFCEESTTRNIPRIFLTQTVYLYCIISKLSSLFIITTIKVNAKGN